LVVNVLRRKPPNFFPRSRQLFQRENFEPGICEISCHDTGIIEVIADTDKLLDLQSFHRRDLICAGSKNRNTELSFPSLNEFRLPFVAEQHERRRPRRMNQIDFVLC
jgi:hypothetical protein